MEANGWKSKFAPEDLVRDEHWTEAYQSRRDVPPRTLPLLPTIDASLHSPVADVLFAAKVGLDEWEGWDAAAWLYDEKPAELSNESLIQLSSCLELQTLRGSLGGFSG